MVRSVVWAEAVVWAAKAVEFVLSGRLLRGLGRSCGLPNCQGDQIRVVGSGAEEGARAIELSA